MAAKVLKNVLDFVAGNFKQISSCSYIGNSLTKALLFLSNEEI